MDKTFCDTDIFNRKNIARKVIVYTSAAMLFAAAPARSALAAETDTPTACAPAETPAQQESQPAANTAPAGTPDNTPVPALPADPTTAAPPADASPLPPTDPTTVAPLPDPAPADQSAPNVTPMQSTVYAASPKGLNVRSGPSTNHSKLGTLKYGQEISVTGITADNWYQIQYSGGSGYVLADYVSSTPLTSAQNPAEQTPDTTVTEPPAAEDPAASTVETPPAEVPAGEPDNEEPAEDSSDEEAYTETTSHLLGTPVLIALAAAIIGVLALICYSVYSLFRKDTETSEGDYADGEYEDESYFDDGYYTDEPYPDDEDYADESYSDDGYYADEPYPDDAHYENESYADEEYREDAEEYLEYEYYEKKDKR